MDTLQKVKSEFIENLNLTSEEFKKKQNAKFKDYLDKIYSKSNYYKNKLNELGIKQEDLPRDIDEINKLPIITKKDLLEWSNAKESLFEDVLDVWTSGTTQEPTKVSYTKESISIGWGELGIRALMLMGMELEKKGMMVTSIDKETRESHPSHINTLALKKILGEKLIDQPIVEPIDETLDLIQSEEVSWIGTVPAYYNSLIFRAKERKIDLTKTKILRSFYGGVGFPKNQREIVEESLDAKLLGFYVITELCTAGTQISEENKLIKEDLEDKYLLFNDYIHFEFLKEDNTPAKKGEICKIIATPFFMEGTPLIRYDLGDKVIFEGYYKNYPLISNIERRKGATFGHGLVSFREFEKMKEELTKAEKDLITGFQVAKTVDSKGIETPVLRIELGEKISLEKEKEISIKAKEIFKSNMHLEVLISLGPENGGINTPEVEFYEYQKLVPAGTFKPKLYSDETK